MHGNAALGWEATAQAPPCGLFLALSQPLQTPCTSSRSTIAQKFRSRVVRQHLVACYASALHLEQARPGAMSSRVFGSAVAPALFAAVFLALCFHQCSCQQVFTLGGATGWTDAVTNVNYTQYMAAVQFKAGDTLCKILYLS